MAVFTGGVDVASNGAIAETDALVYVEIARRGRELNDHWLQSHYGALSRFFSLRLANPSDIDDLVQETLIKVHKYFIDYNIRIDRGEYCEAYMFRNAANVLTDFLRKMTVRRQGLHAHIEDVAEGDWLASNNCLSFDPEGELEMQQCRDHLNRCLAALNPRTRNIFSLSRFTGLSCKDISREEGVSVSSVEKHLNKARAALHEFYEMM